MLSLTQKIKVLKDRELTLPVMMCATEPYNPDKPTIFDSSIHVENIKVNQVINALLGVIQFLMKELMISNKVLPRETWKKMTEIRQMLAESRSTITRK